MIVGITVGLIVLALTESPVAAIIAALIAGSTVMADEDYKEVRERERMKSSTDIIE